jgi:hypothetical protein
MSVFIYSTRQLLLAAILSFLLRRREIMDVSNGTRKGTIVGKPSKAVLKSTKSRPETNVVFFSIKSEIAIGMDETVEDEAMVMLVGDAANQWLNMDQKPKEGDVIRIYGAVFYLKDGKLCFRVMDTSEYEVEILRDKAKKSEDSADSSKKSKKDKDKNKDKTEYVQASEYFFGEN